MVNRKKFCLKVDRKDQLSKSAYEMVGGVVEEEEYRKWDEQYVPHTPPHSKETSRHYKGE